MVMKLCVSRVQSGRAKMTTDLFRNTLAADWPLVAATTTSSRHSAHGIFTFPVARERARSGGARLRGGAEEREPRDRHAGHPLRRRRRHHRAFHNSSPPGRETATRGATQGRGRICRFHCPASYTRLWLRGTLARIAGEMQISSCAPHFSSLQNGRRPGGEVQSQPAPNITWGAGARGFTDHIFYAMISKAVGHSAAKTELHPAYQHR